MKLIIERITNDFYAYLEPDDHYVLAQEYRVNSKKLRPEVLDKDCDLESLPKHSYIVFELAEQPTPKKKAAKKKPAKKKKRGK